MQSEQIEDCHLCCRHPERLHASVPAPRLMNDCREHFNIGAMEHLDAGHAANAPTAKIAVSSEMVYLQRLV